MIGAICRYKLRGKQTWGLWVRDMGKGEEGEGTGREGEERGRRRGSRQVEAEEMGSRGRPEGGESEGLPFCGDRLSG